ncbi:MAG: LysM peptidoglycan-binding domain-containing protein [Bacteroides sp.]|nr:LysM peptidoglycan-binding domain-containing protein [Bacteroides sp.]
MFSQLIKRFVCCLAVLAVAATVCASVIDTLPVKNVNGTSYHYYTVQPQESLYALSKRFGKSEKEILKLNPDAANGLKAGQQLLLAKAKDSKAETYVVKKQETAYGISKRFGISLERFYELNPDAVDGVREGQTVVIRPNSPAKNSQSKAADVKKEANDKSSASVKTTISNSGKKHVIAEHETLYQIARDNNISLAELLAANPNLDSARYAAGTTIVIPQSDAQTSPSGNSYLVKAGDTFYGIASRHGVDVAQLYAANPGVETLQEGMTIVLPESCAEPRDEPQAMPAETPKSKMTVAVVLPFMLEEQDKHNKSVVEFYRGFLLAVDSLRNSGHPIHVLTFDTNNTSEGLDAVLQNPSLKEAQAIIAPDNAEHLAALNQFGLDNKIMVLNLFNNRDTAYLSNPYSIQAALPRDDMYSRAAKAFIDTFQGYTPVFLVSDDGRKDKLEFITVVKEQLDKAGKTYKEVGYSGTLSLEALNTALQPGEKYAFLPASSHKDEFDHVSTAIAAYKDARDFKNEVVVWGYPEWLANRAAYSKMHELDSYVYSRNDLPETFTAEAVNRGYAKWFGPNMIQSFPRRAYMGFDAGMFLLNSLSFNGGDFTKGTPYVSSLTLPLTLKRVQNGGLFNNDLLLINLAPGEIISKRAI